MSEPSDWEKLQAFAQIRLKRPLTPEELQQLEAFYRANREAIAIKAGDLYQTMAHSTGILFENAVAAQQQQNTMTEAAANQGVMQIYSLDTTAAAGATEKVAQTGVADNLTSLLTVLDAFYNP